MQHPVKLEPGVEPTKWRLIAVSQAARLRKNIIVLETNQNYLLGRSRNSDIHISSPFCSKVHCELIVRDMEVILKDESTHGTYVNQINYKGSRSILSHNDRLGFGCSTTNRHLKDMKDVKYHVYRLSNENELKNDEPIELLDSDDDETEIQSGYGNGTFNNNHDDSEDECPSADEMDVKPDIHTLMRMAQESMKIKEEVTWNCYEYEREQERELSRVNDVKPVDKVDLESLNVESDLYVVEPPQKRYRRIDSNGFDLNYQLPENVTLENDANVHDSEFQQDTQQNDGSLNVVTEYQLSDTTMKEKVKLVKRSRGQQLSTDMINAAKPKEKAKIPTTNNATNIFASFADNLIPSTSKASPEPDAAMQYRIESEIGGKSVDGLKNEFISDITKWDYNWIHGNKSNPLQYRMNIRHLDTNYENLDSFQQQMKNFLLMETYSIIYSEYCTKTMSAHTFTSLTSCIFDSQLKRFIYQCYTTHKDCRVEDIKSNDFVVVTNTKKGRFLAYVTKSKGTTGGWEFELQASSVDNNRNDLTNVKFIQVTFITNIQTMLENFVSLYELRHSTLQDVFLRPSSQFDDFNSSDEFVQKRYPSIVDKMYEKCAVSVFGGSKILLCNGAAGTGKTSFIRHLLERFASENFQITNSILVCGRHNALVDGMVDRMMTRTKIKNIARFGKLAMMKPSIRKIGVEMFDPKLNQQNNVVFTTLDKAVDLLYANRTFDVCIVDDASLFSEAELLPLFRLKITTLLLVGDESLQTSSTQNECCRENGYSRSLFTRVIESYRKFDLTRTFFPTLYRQRRMHREISLWPNNKFYHGKMIQLENPPEDPMFWPYTVFQVNTVEDIEVTFMRQLLEFCVKFRKPTECSYGIICGHPKSKEELTEMIKDNPQFKGIKISDYDSFQGQQKDIIIMVALKPDDGFKLFGTKENLLIALTRAKQSFILCGNFQHVCTKVDGTNADEMSSKWTEIMTDAKIRKRFFDLNGTFDELQMYKLIK